MQNSQAPEILIVGGDFERLLSEHFHRLCAERLPSAACPRVQFERGAPAVVLEQPRAGFPRELFREGLLPADFRGCGEVLNDSPASIVVLSLSEDLASPVWRNRTDGSYFVSLPGGADPQRSAWFAENYEFIDEFDPELSLRSFEAIIARLTAGTPPRTVCLCNVFRGLRRSTRHRYFNAPPDRRERALQLNLHAIELSRRYGIVLIDIDCLLGAAGFSRLLPQEMPALAGEELLTALQHCGALD